ncbi:MAG: type II secretion system protein [bacterium]|nr:type II secretion system protein [bacterium]
MKNKKGFTLVELIVVITLIAIVAVIATPNVIKLVDNGRKEQILTDAKNFLSDVKYKSNLIKYEEYFPTEGRCKEICASNSLFGQDLDKDPDGNSYDKDFCCVNICVNAGISSYSVKLASKNEGNFAWGISSSTTEVSYVLEANLDKDAVVRFNID